MQSSGPGVDGFGSIPNLDSEYCALNSDNSPKNAASRTDIELNTTAHARNALARARVYGAECKSVLIILRKCDCLFKKVCIVHTLILAAIWILCTTPIIVFYVTSAMITSNATSYEGNSVEYTTTSVSTKTDRECSDGFYLDNSSDLCRPECGEWDQYTQSTRDRVVGINITFVLISILICLATFVWSVFRYKIMFRFPNIMLVYITISRTVFSILHVVGYVDEKALYCTSRDQVTSFENGSPYCTIIGAATTFIPSFNFTVLCFQLGTVLFGVYFPFRARECQSKGHCKYIHLVALINAVSFSALLVGIQFGLGGYSRTMVPIFCLADTGSAFVFSVIPTCVILAIFLSLVMLLLFKIFDIAGWKLKTKPVEPGDGKSNNSTHRYTSAQVKLVLTFCANGVSNVINYSLYSVVLKKEDTYSQALEHYFNCESTGVEFGKSCDRSAFEALDASPITFPLSTIVYILSPLATLIYVANIDKFTKKYCKAKLRRRKQFQMHVLRKQLSQHS